MNLSRSIQRQLSRIERGFAEREHPAETERDRFLQKCAERYAQEQERYLDCIDLVLESLDEDYFQKVMNEIEGAEWEQIDFRMYGEFGRNNGLSTLTNAVLSMADAKYRGRQFSPIFPRGLCEYFESEPMEKFIHKPGGEGYSWFSGCVSCESCFLPLPAKPLLCGGLYGVRSKRDEAGFDETLPFKKCPACGGGVEWTVHQK